jgi:iron complex outermembrane recepter protein
MRRYSGWTALFLSSAMTIAAGVPAACAHQDARQDYDLPAQALAQAVREVARISGRSIAAPAALLAGRSARPLRGRFTVEDALARLLEGSDIRARPEGDGVILEAARSDAQAQDEEEVLVTGSRIRGAQGASPVIRLSREEIRATGQASLGEVVRSLPQSFGGGQNPGVGANVPSSSGVNVGGGSSLNLRGIGSDATLTLLNGHRLSYNSSRQSIDVSAIPLGAIERIEIVPDGASALYGSDAVAGVANIVLRRDADTIEASARLGASTDGGNVEQRYGATAGSRWGSGGAILSYEFARNTAIYGRDRTYAADKSPALTLFPPLRNHSAVASLHQALAPGLSFEIDALFNQRWSIKAVANNAAGDVRQSGIVNDYSTRSIAIAPTLRMSPGGSWRAFASGAWGQDHTRFTVTTWARGVASTPPEICYCNSAGSAEVGADGPLLEMPGGLLRLALGVGYRINTFIRDNGPGNPQNIDESQDSYYGYGELNLPILSPAMASTLGERLSLSAAVRYEQYPGIGDIATPKLGLVYAPTPDFEVKGSWGRSFRAPTLLEKYQPRALVLIAPSALGGKGYPAGSTALFVQGGNADLAPERARTWSGTVVLHPRALEGMTLELSWFDIDYRDRVVVPIAFIAQSLSNPAYTGTLTMTPDRALLDTIVASALSFVNASGAPYDPARVAVLIDDTSVNAGRQAIHGLDLLFRYEARGERGNTLSATLNASYLASRQQISSTQPETRLAGQIFNPPHVRARGVLSWSGAHFGLTAAVNYIGGVDDPRAAQTFRVGAMKTLDLAARYRIGGAVRGVELSASVQNLLNDAPTRIATTQFSDTPYDSTNYSPVGRFVSFGVRATW